MHSFWAVLAATVLPKVFAGGSLQRFSLQSAAWPLSINQRKALKSHLMQRPPISGQRKGTEEKSCQ